MSHLPLTGLLQEETSRISDFMIENAKGTIRLLYQQASVLGPVATDPQVLGHRHGGAVTEVDRAVLKLRLEEFEKARETTLRRFHAK